MFDISAKKANVALRIPDESEPIIAALITSGEYKPLVRSIISAAYAVVGSPPDFSTLNTVFSVRFERSETYSAEVFFKENELYFLYVDSSGIAVWTARPHSIESQISRFCDDLTSIAKVGLDGRRLRGMDFTWLNALSELPSERRSKRPTLETTEPEYSELEAKQAETLCSTEHRGYLLRLAQLRGRVRSVDASADTASGVIQPLLEQGLVGKEYLVVCRQDSHTICTAGETEKATIASSPLMKCTVCGRALANEFIQEISAITEAGTKLLSGSRWMTIGLPRFCATPACGWNR
jgi:hypothetical protein